MTPEQRGKASIDRGMEIIRDRMIAAMDECFCDGQLGLVLWQQTDSPYLHSYGLRVLQAIQLTLFPEQFLNMQEMRARQSRDITYRFHPKEISQLILELGKQGRK